MDIAILYPNELIVQGLTTTVQALFPQATISTQTESPAGNWIKKLPQTLEAIIFQPNDGKEVEQLRLKFPSIKVIIIDKTPTQDRIQDLLNTAPDGYLLECCPLKEVSIALTNIITKQEHFFCDSIQRKSQTSTDDCFTLTRTELQILRLLQQGHTTKAIAEQTFRSQHTINTHRKNMLKKMSCKNTAEMLHFALDNNLI